MLITIAITDVIIGIMKLNNSILVLGVQSFEKRYL